MAERDPERRSEEQHEEVEFDFVRHRGDTPTVEGEQPIREPDEGEDVEQWRERDAERTLEDPGGYY